MERQSIFNSTVFNKVVMAVTGFIVVGFIAGHALGNLQIFAGKEAYNSYAYFLEHGIGKILHIIRAVLAVSIVLHVLTSVKLKLLNLKAKPEKYKIKKYLKAGFSSRSMIYTGIMTAGFVAFHLLHYKLGFFSDAGFGKYSLNYHGELISVKDVYTMVSTGFADIRITAVYLIAVTALGFHLSHSLQSMFSSIGLVGQRHSEKAGLPSSLIAALITAMFYAPPLGVLTGIISY